MPKRRPSPVHLGGPLGLAGVTLLASAVGLVVVANDSRQSAAGQKQTAEQTVTDSRPPAGAVGVEQLRPAPAARDAHALPAAATKEVASAAQTKPVRLVWEPRAVPLSPALLATPKPTSLRPQAPPGSDQRPSRAPSRRAAPP